MGQSTTNHQYQKISNLFKNLSYFDQYGTQVVIVTILIILLYVVYAYVKNMQKIQPIRDNWAARRCDTDVIPMAGMINKPEGSSVLEFTAENFNFCVSNILKPIANKAVSPFDYLMNGLLKIYGTILKAIQFIRNLVNYIRAMLFKIIKNIYSRMVYIVTPLQEIVIRSRDLMGKVVAILEVGLNTALSTFLTLKALLNYIASAAASVLIIGAIAIAVLIGMIAACYFFCQPLLPYLIGLLTTYSIAYAIITIILVILIVFIRNVQGDSPGVSMYTAPKCFDGKTEIKLKNKEIKYMKDVKLGDILEDGGRVTAKLKLSSVGESIYKLGNVIVTGRHRVIHNGKWIPVSSHPESEFVPTYTETYVYCLNTTTKVLNIDGKKFMDWDEIYEKRKNLLQKEYEKNNETLTTQDNLEFIHSYFDGGIVENTMIEKHGSMPPMPVQKIEIFDLLANNIEVYGIVEVDSSTIKNKKNILHGKKRNDETTNLETSSSKVYHFLTCPGYFYLNNQKINDYNNYIDAVV